MKKIIISALILISSITAFSATNLMPAKPITLAAANKTTTQTKKIITINLYASPDAKSKVIKILPVDTDLVIIFNKGNWVKVGDRVDGTTGWLSLAQYQAAKHAFYQSHFHADVNTLYIQMSKNKNGKAVVEAYQNGKKLSEEDANKLYEHMKAQQEMQWKQIQHFNHVLTRQVNRDFILEKHGMENIFEMPTVFPGVIVIENPKKPVQNSAR